MFLKNIYSKAKKAYIFLVNIIFYIVFKIYKILTIILKYKKNNKYVLILTNDHIGDAVIRIKYFNKYQELYGKYNVYFLVSNSNKEIMKLISDNIIVYDDRRFRRSLFYKLSFTLKINMFSKVISLVPYNRHNSNLICNLIIGEKEINFNYDDGECGYLLDKLTEMYNKITNSNYTNNYFKPNLTKCLKKCNIDKFNIGKNYIVLGMGADSIQRVYPASKFIKVLNYIISNNKETKLVFLGYGSNDENYFEEICKLIDIKDNRVINLISKTSMVETLNIISRSKLFLGVESGLWNCAYALNVPSIVIYGGGHFGRFMHDSDDITYVYKSMNCFQCNWQCIYNNDINVVSKCIQSIEPDQIIEALTNKLELKYINL